MLPDLLVRVDGPTEIAIGDTCREGVVRICLPRPVAKIALHRSFVIIQLNEAFTVIVGKPAPGGIDSHKYIPSIVAVAISVA
jgi:hypothetical protein